jgi:glycosyltransferase involved in cell wall biosynthesis
LIRFYKDPDEYGSWTGNGGYVLNITQDMINRGRATNFEFWNESTKGIPRILIGRGAEALGAEALGVVSYEETKVRLRECGVYFYTGTYPASYVLNFMEALMTGCPIVALGEFMGNDTMYPEMRTYEIPDFAKLTRGIITCDDVASARLAVRKVLNGGKEVEEMSEDNRKLAKILFGKDVIKNQWKKYLLETDGKKVE